MNGGGEEFKMEWQYEQCYPTELYHHGILGQKWGVRRYQYSDGTLTPAGKKRYRIDNEGNLVEKSKSERASDAKAAKQAKLEKQRQTRLERENETVEKKKERIAKTADPEQIYKNRELFTDQELRSLYSRMQVERDIKNLMPKGKTFVDKLNKISSQMEATSKAIDAGGKFYNSIAKTSNALANTDLPIIGDKKETKYDKAEKQAKYYKNKVSIEKSKETLKEMEESHKKGEKIKKKNETPKVKKATFNK